MKDKEIKNALKDYTNSVTVSDELTKKTIAKMQQKKFPVVLKICACFIFIFVITTIFTKYNSPQVILPQTAPNMPALDQSTDNTSISLPENSVIEAPLPNYKKTPTMPIVNAPTTNSTPTSTPPVNNLEKDESIPFIGEPIINSALSPLDTKDLEINNLQEEEEEESHDEKDIEESAENTIIIPNIN